MRNRDQAKRNELHDLRVKTKRLRARARILKFLDKPSAKPLELKLKSFAKVLSPIRDRDVEIEWLLKHRYQPLKTLRPRLPISKIKAGLGVLALKVNTALTNAAITEKTKSAALRNSKKKTAKAWKKASESKRKKDFHEWRKRAKDLQYQMEFFGQSQKQKAVKKMAQELGTAQDGVLMQELFKSRPVIAPDGAMRVARKETKAARQKALRLARKALS